MRLLRSVTPTPEQLRVLADVRPGFRIIRGAAGSGKTTTALLRLREQIAVRLDRRQRHGFDAPVRVLVLTFNRTLEGYIAALARESAPDDDALDLEISTFSGWARSLVGNVSILGRNEASALLRPHLREFVPAASLDFFVHEVGYVLGRFAPGDVSEYLEVAREGRGRAPSVRRRVRQRLLDHVLPAYAAAKAERGKIDWNDLALLAADAEPDRLYDVVIVDEAQDFSANQVRAILQHLDESHNTTFVLDAVQRIYPQFFRWIDVGIDARPGMIYRLQENYRNTAAIAAFAHPLVEGLPVEDDGTLPDFTACRRDGIKPVVVAGKYSAQLRVMLDRIERTADLATESVALLQPLGGGWFDEARRVLRRRGIPFCELTRENEWPSGPENVALCTIHSAKGLEFDHVLVPGLSRQVTPHGAEEGDADLDRLRRMLAMAVGRARESVMIGYKPGEESSLIGLLDPATYELVKVDTS
ncbi:MAG: UvrD-helicase domain-containing protein [bacterium]|nr:UvrD-helicase domain-containing protein [bacterium]MCY3951239.1 UvrD-helicase domain-containing protein [bacterium]